MWKIEIFVEDEMDARTFAKYIDHNLLVPGAIIRILPVDDDEVYEVLDEEFIDNAPLEYLDDYEGH